MLLLSIVILTTSTQILFATFSETNSLSTLDILLTNGYEAESHSVVTVDGYILELHRITKSRSGQSPTRNHAVLIHHGLLGSSADWVIGGPEMSLPMQLSDDGYDVWLANSRGNTYSRNHDIKSSDDRAFWDFSLHEIAVKDLPAIINTILMETETTQLHYIGYSMGSTVFFILLSQRPEYHTKIRSHISLAPAVYLSETRSPIRHLAPYAQWMNKIVQVTKNGMVLPETWHSKLTASTVCKIKVIEKYLCQNNIIYLLCGEDFEHINKNLLPAIKGHFPAGSSSKTLSHYSQFILNDTFNQYDYGRDENMLRYNNIVPPLYDISSIQVPTTLFYGFNDKISTPEDVMKLIPKLPLLIDVIEVKNLHCHLDYLWSVKVKELINDPIKESLRKTDNLHWEFKELNPYAAYLAMPLSFGNDGNQDETNDIIAEHRALNPLKNSKYLNFLVDSMNTLYASYMTPEVDNNEFHQEQKQENLLFGKLKKYYDKVLKNYGRFWEDLVNEISEPAGDVNDK